jgi:hypothetical protein
MMKPIESLTVSLFQAALLVSVLAVITAGV